MQEHLKALTPVTGGEDLREVMTRERVNAIQGAIHALAAGENISTEGGIRKMPGAGRVRLGGARQVPVTPRQGRFQVTHDAGPMRLSVGEGWVYDDGPESDSGAGSVFAEPREVTLGGAALGTHPSFSTAAVAVGEEYEVTCVFNTYEARVELNKTDDRPDPGEGWVVFLLARMTFKAAGSGGRCLDWFEQVWESDILWQPGAAAESSGGSSSGGPDVGGNLNLTSRKWHGGVYNETTHNIDYPFGLTHTSEILYWRNGLFIGIMDPGDAPEGLIERTAEWVDYEGDPP